MISVTIDTRYGYILEHYYQKYNYSNLLSVTEYKQQRGNFFSIINALSSKNTKVTSIKEGNTNINHQNTVLTKGVYLINDELYVMFDWENEEIVSLMNTYEVQELIVERLKISDAEVITYAATFLRIQHASGEKIMYQIIPVDSGFDFVLLTP
ncbi:hypothetical protein [Bacillus alkalicellulosilyticus]|uniref:hypothetical protein n=1 Tax=Alkalihalobacterium alkalicellulosilyticum TaxID=1912214 RepID=UPI001116524B|nr:hypothetical protein [Bacillus alkalicellulosilyticus]